MSFAHQSYDVVGIGRSYIDIIASVPYSFLEKYQIPLNSGCYFDAPVIDAIIRELENPVYYPGGAIPNTIAGLAALEAKTGYFGKVANDKAGNLFLNDLRQRQIDDLANGPLQGESVSGICVVLLTPEGERSFALHKGCVDHYQEKDFDRFTFSAAKYLLFGANLIASATVSSVISYAVKKAAQTSCQIVVTMSEIRDWEGRRNIATDIIKPHAHIIIGNEEENRSLMEITGPLKDQDRLIITTMGADGARAERNGECVHVPAVKHPRIVSSLGAGDQFLAGFLKGMALDLSLKESLELAANCADIIIQETEARPQVGVSWKHLLG